ncbi:MAG: nucleotidyl transferase AbiEii/AbiGii toxin family protein [Bacteroidales bacterium]|nr:nucleotidyl transferase AbiEii/AbiGii toxin family protein [Bacteroidales bacterium]
MNDIYQQMLSAYDLSTKQLMRNAKFEINQQVILAGLYRGGFFDAAAFYGGTCLRIFHGLDRFSEDLDFSLTAPDDQFHIEKYFPYIEDEFALLGRKVEIRKKEKRTFGRVESAFLKDNTEVADLVFQTEKNIKIKIEVDTDPQLHFQTENKLLLLPFSFMVRCFTLPDLFAGKMHALLFRSWKQRVKGRDWYDFEWYVRHGVPLDFVHLQERALQFNGLEMSKEDFKERLRERLSSTNIGQVKQDVTPFMKNREETAIWSNGYFLQLAEMIRFKEG